MKSSEQKPAGPSRTDDSKQQQAQSGEGQQYGEGNYKATRQYNEGMKEHVQNHDIEKEARDAAPRSKDEERELEDAEREAASRAKGSSAKAEDDPNVN